MFKDVTDDAVVLYLLQFHFGLFSDVDCIFSQRINEWDIVLFEVQTGYPGELAYSVKPIRVLLFMVCDSVYGGCALGLSFRVLDGTVQCNQSKFFSHWQSSDSWAFTINKIEAL